MEDKTLLVLFDKFEKSDAVELKFAGDGFSFELRRKGAFTPASAPMLVSGGMAGSAELHAEAKAPSAHTSSTAPHAPAGGSGAAAPGFEYIKSPIVGTFYRAPSADTPAFADVGKKILKGQKLCIIEAMKMMNALEAEFDCEIVKILVNNGDMVEFEQPIFEVRPV